MSKYLVVQLNGAFNITNPNNHQSILDNKANEGWELVQIIAVNHEATTDKLFFYFKKST